MWHRHHDFTVNIIQDLVEAFNNMMYVIDWLNMSDITTWLVCVFLQSMAIYQVLLFLLNPQNWLRHLFSSVSKSYHIPQYLTFYCPLLLIHIWETSLSILFVPSVLLLPFSLSHTGPQCPWPLPSNLSLVWGQQKQPLISPYISSVAQTTGVWPRLLHRRDFVFDTIIYTTVC